MDIDSRRSLGIYNKLTIDKNFEKNLSSIFKDIRCIPTDNNPKNAYCFIHIGIKDSDNFYEIIHNISDQGISYRLQYCYIDHSEDGDDYQFYYTDEFNY